MTPHRPPADPGPPTPGPLRPRRTVPFERTPFPWRFGLYAAAILYLFADLYWLGGPLARRLGRDPAEEARRHEWIARVYGRPIPRAEFDRALAARLARRGRTPADLAAMAPDDALGLRLRVLDQLIEDRILAAWSRDEPDLDVAPDATPDERGLAWIEHAIAGAIAGGADDADHPETAGRVTPEQRARQENDRRDAAVATLRQQLRTRAAEHIEVYYDNLTP